MSVDSKPKEVNKLTKTVRRRKVIRLRARGVEIEDIAKQLGVSEKTVDRDLASPDAQKFVDELVQRQIIDIESAKKLTVRLHYRSDLLDKLLPRKPAVNVDVNVQQNQSAGEHSLLAEYASVISEASASNGNIPEVRASESVDSKQAASGDGEKRSDSEASQVPAAA